MHDTSFSRMRPGRAFWLLPLAALIAACAPDQSDRGYTAVTHRGGPPPLPEAAHPQPPAVPPGTQIGGAQERLVATSLPAGVTQEMVDAGQQHYSAGVCATCHGAGGAGTPTGPRLNDGEWLHIGGEFAEIVAIINSGVTQPRQFSGMMPPRGGGPFTDEQVNEIAAYVYALSHQGGS